MLNPPQEKGRLTPWIYGQFLKDCQTDSKPVIWEYVYYECVYYEWWEK